METLRIMALCVTGAMICATMRSAHPQIAAAAALAFGIGAMMLLLPQITIIAETARALAAESGGEDPVNLLRVCGIAILAEFASDICRDANEAALAHRIEIAVRVGLLAGAIPILNDLIQRISEILQ